MTSKTAQVIPTLKTERLTLRPITIEDRDAIFSYASNPNVSRYTMWEPHQTPEDSESFINEYILPNYQKGVLEPLGVGLAETPQDLIGTVGCFWVSKNNKCMELAYALAEPFWGKGLIVEASEALLDFVFKNFDVERVQSRHKVGNDASGRVMQKLGMKYEGQLRKAIFHRQQFWDIRYYSILKEEWLNR